MQILEATNTPLGFVTLTIFIIAYGVVILEEVLNLHKCKPVILAAGFIWICVALIAKQKGVPEFAELSLKRNITEYCELLLFLLSAMTYVNVMVDRKIFEVLRVKLLDFNLSLRSLFWLTGIITFFLSPIVDNLTASLIMGTVVITMGKKYPKFIILSCINIVVAANAGGAFSPFGDITTLMVWQKGILKFHEFFVLIIPSLVSYIIPAAIMSIYIPKVKPKKLQQTIKMAIGAKRVILLFILTIMTAIWFNYYLHLPPSIGMITGLGYLSIFDYYLLRKHKEINYFNVLKKFAGIEWDTLLFFYGIILAVGGLASIGYLQFMSTFMYDYLGHTTANISLGILSAIVDNIPIMYALLTMSPAMSENQWLLATLTIGIGGNLLSIGSAAGVALMGQARGIYTFSSHLKWSFVILVGYFAGIATHLWLH